VLIMLQSVYQHKCLPITISCEFFHSNHYVATKLLVALKSKLLHYIDVAT
jgi:hypothetical protein